MICVYVFQGFEVDMVKIIGLDPGLQRTGWGVISSIGNSLSYIDHGVIETNPKALLADRLNSLYQGIFKVLQQLQPQEAAVEETFVNKNPTSTLKLGMARGVVLFTPASFGLQVSEYSANKVKKSVVGSGHADKHQVAQMICMLLPTMPKNVTADAADALAIAICHAHHRWISQSLTSIS
jgi:crossover junction endodeoxyribonuclease RuvC